MKYKDWDECIHIHACRRLTKIANNALFGKGKKGKLTRMCGKDRCDCFKSKDEIKETSRLVCELKDRIKWIRDEGGEMENYNCQQYYEGIERVADELAEIYEVQWVTQIGWDYDHNCPDDYDSHYSSPIHNENFKTYIDTREDWQK